MGLQKKNNITPYLGDRVYCYLSRDERRWVEKNKEQLGISLSEVIRLSVLFQMQHTNNGTIKYKTKVNFKDMPEDEA